MLAIETDDLSHRFASGAPALRQVCLQVPTGSVYGFLGPNGAGKTTALRLILGLLDVQQGQLRVLGQRSGAAREQLLRRVGSSIESPSLYAQLTARENLLVWQRVFGCPARRVAEVLEQVGLGGTGKKRAGEFSLGMKQRLGLAVALLHEPELLILDEPTNGLDPHGILELRGLLVELNRTRGTTVLISSHLLSEVQRLVTHVGILRAGALVFQGTLASLAASRAEGEQVAIDTSDNLAALALLEAAGLRPRLEGGKLALRGLSRGALAEITRGLVEAGLGVHELCPGANGLEQTFLELVGA
jgi:ABC-2 type transport system ATP-binding protein